MSSKIKVYELAKELGQDSQHLVDVIQRLGVDIKNPMSVLGSEEVRSVREYFRKQKPLTKSTPAPVAKAPVTEKRVGATVIRRRAKPTDKPEPVVEKVEETPVEATEMAPVEELQVEAAVEETVVEAAPEETPVVEEEVAPEVTEVTAAAPAPVTPAAAAPPTPPAPPTKTPIKEVDIAGAKAAAAARPPERKIIKRSFPSIIKKVSTETHLVDKIGPKPPAPVKKEDKPATTTATGTTTDKTGLKRVKEIELVPVEPAAKEVAKRRVMSRQDSVFKSADFLKRELVHSLKKRKTVVNRPAMKTQLTKPAEHKRVVEMADTILVSELAKEMGTKAAVVISKLMAMGVAATVNQRIDHDSASLVAQELGFEIKQKVFKEEDFLPKVDMAGENLQARGPVVTIMGHVDHGKTSLLDAIRKTKVAAGEAGGITQHVGAYTVKLPKGKIAFIDTPGHEAFTAMRARGAKVTDIVVIVVSAVDGVMPQTLESINHAKAGNVPIIVAINKIDLPDGNPDRIKTTLAGHGLNPEEWGGDTIYVPVSAKTGKGLDQLLESILLQAELLELKANYDMPARGTVVESRLDKNRGPLAIVLVQHGRLKTGEMVVCGVTYGKVRAMNGPLGERMSEALPGDPVELLGLPAVPNVGDEFSVVEDEKTAKALTGARTEVARVQASESKQKMTLEEMMSTPTGDRELRVILKSDVQGSGEALRESLMKFPQDRVRLKVLHTATGGITESDVMLAAASKAVILGFNVRPELKASKLAESEGVQLKSYSIIYELLEDVKKLLEGLLEIEHKEKVIGRAEVRNVFHIPKIGAIAGSAVLDGKVIRGCFLRLLRDNRVVYEGKISSLKRFKEDVREVASGFECGIGLENFNDVKMGDHFEAFVKEEVKGSL